MRLLACALAFLVAGVGFNVLIDPYGIFFWFERQGINAYKPDVLSNWRTAKPLRQMLLRPDALLVGSSRVLGAWDPAHPAFAKFDQPYNYGIPGPVLCELSKNFEFALQTRVPKRVVIGLDLFGANALFEGAPCELPPELQNRALALPRVLISANTFNAAQKTLFGQRRRDPNIWQPTPNGVAAISPEMPLKQGGMRAAFEYFAYGALDVQYLPRPVCRLAIGADDPTRDTMRHFRRMLDLARAQGVEVQVTLHPVHAYLLQSLDAVGLWPQYEAWKRLVTATVEDEARAAGAQPFPLWDFSGYNALTTEAIPPAGDKRTLMTNYWDPSHYRIPVGNAMFDRMFDVGAPRADFGVRLASADIDAHLARLRQGRDAYAATHPAEVAEIAAIVARIRQRPGCAAPAGREPRR